MFPSGMLDLCLFGYSQPGGCEEAGGWGGSNAGTCARCSDGGQHVKFEIVFGLLIVLLVRVVFRNLHVHIPSGDVGTSVSVSMHWLSCAEVAISGDACLNL